MEQEVVEFTCDNCGADATTSNSELPFHWVQIQYMLHYGSLEKIDICDDCREAFEKALEGRRGKQ